MLSTAASFMNLFSGLMRAHGEYRITEQKGQKAVGKAITKKEPVTKELWNGHLAGKVGIGIIPIRDDSTVFFGAIDIDSYDGMDLAALSQTITKNQWPVIPCRSKSGGAHVYLFTNEPVKATILRSKLKQIAIALGHPKAEIFPKQDAMYGQDDIGNWINMPYFGGDNSTRYALNNGTALTVEEFITISDQFKISLGELEELMVSAGEFCDAPPCLEQLTASGFPPGTMNAALFNMGVYARMKYPEGWQQYVFEYNQRFMGPGTNQEVNQIIKSLDKKKYTYKCSESPVCGVCDKNICATRRFSPMGDFSPYRSEASKKTARPSVLSFIEPPVICLEPPEDSNDEPYWIFKLHGIELDVSVDMVQSQQKFLRGYLKKFKKLALPVNEDRWAKEMNEILESAELHQLASDAGPEGQLLLFLESFCNGKTQARVQEELILGKPWTSEEGRVYFRAQDFKKYLDLNRFSGFNERQIYAVLRRHGCTHHKLMLKGKCVACWSMVAYTQQDSDFSIPDVSKGEY